jgi:hypothetical protein
MLRALQAERSKTITDLMAAVATMMAEVDPGGVRDHRSLWELSPRERARRPDIFNRLRYGCDELVIIGTQMVNCQPWATSVGRVGLEVSSPAEQRDAAGETVGVFRLLVLREAGPLELLERDVKGVQLQRGLYPNLRAAALPRAVKDLRAQHTAAGSVVYLLGKVAA